MVIMATDLEMEKEDFSAGGQSIIPMLSRIDILHQFKKLQGFVQPDILYTMLLHNFVYIPNTFPSWEETETQVIEIPIDYRKFYNPSEIIRPWLEKEEEPQDVEQKAFLTIATEFSQIEKVQSIYVQKYREELQIQTLLSITQYDDDLMDALLDIEYDIRKGYPEIVFEFFYPPVGISEKKDIIHPEAMCVYSR